MMLKKDQTEYSRYISVKLDVNHDTGIASIILSRSATQSSWSPALLNKMVDDSNISSWAINQEDLTQAFSNFKKSKEGLFSFGKRVDAKYRVSLSEDMMSASITATPAVGGKSLTVKTITDDLIERGIRPERIILKAVEELVNTNSEVTVEVAAGIQPKAGRNSRFVELVENHNALLVPTVDENDIVDYLSGKEYLSVSAGTPLMRRLPPEPGKVGVDIFGEIITPRSGTEIPFGKNLKGAVFSTNDPNLIIAEVSGHPIYLSDGVRVDETLRLKNVSVATGHVTFDGSVHITGDVMPDMKVNVTGDVFIQGVIERATVIAGNNIQVAGVLGDVQLDIEQSAPQNYECIIEARGSIEARYVNLAKLTAGTDIHIREYAFNSSLQADSRILLGQNGGKGNLAGGSAIAGHAICGKTLGSHAYVHTHLRVGATLEEVIQLKKLKILRGKKTDLHHMLKERFNEVRKVAQAATSKANPETLEKFKTAILQVQKDIKDIDHRIKAIRLASFDGDEPNITTTLKCYPNCFLTINGAHMKTSREHKPIVFIQRGANITAQV